MCENSQKEHYEQKVFCSFSFCNYGFHCGSGSIAVFADDFVEEKDPVIDNGDVKPVETEVVWNKENFWYFSKRRKFCFRRQRFKRIV